MQSKSMSRWLLRKVCDVRVILAVFAVTACLAVSGHAAVLVDRIVAVVNDEIIRLVELNEKFASFERQIRSQGHAAEKEQELVYQKRMDVLNDMIDEKLADQQIFQAGIIVGEAEIDHAVEQIKANNSYTDEELRQALALSGIDMKTYREEIRKQILRNRLVNLKVTSSIIITQTDIQAYQEAHPEFYGPRKQYQLRNIMMSWDRSADAKSRQAVYDRMVDVVEKLETGESFAKMAESCSEAVNAVDGGLLGLFALNDLSENIADAISPLQPGQCSSIIETDHGYQIFYVEAIMDAAPKTEDDSAAEIRKKLYEERVNEKFNAWIEKLRQDAHIKIIY